VSGAYETVKTARSTRRPTSMDFISGLFTGFIELHGDRRFADDRAVVGGLARLGERAVTVIGIEKGHSTRERMLRSFGAPQPEGYRKALRLMKQAEKFRRPVISFIDTSGAYCGIGAEERGQGQAIAENLMEMMTLRTPTISLVIGEGGSGGALALGAADRVWMLENAIYSVISPEGCASILWKDASKAETAAEVLKLTARDSLRGGLIDEVISEEGLGEERFWHRLRGKLTEALRELDALPPEALTEARYRRFRAIGTDRKEG